jgi:hypothetical protein
MVVSTMASTATSTVFLGILAAVVVVLAGDLAAAFDASVPDILRQPARFAGQLVTIHGTMSPTRPTASPGRVLFDVREGVDVITVLAPTMPACPPSSMVTVDGRFHPIMQADLQPLQNVVEAFAVVCR